MQDQFNGNNQPSGALSMVSRLHFMDLVHDDSSTLWAYFTSSLTPQEARDAQAFLQEQMERLGVSAIEDISQTRDTCWTQISLTFKTFAGQQPADLLHRMVKFVESQRAEAERAERAAALARNTLPQPKLETIL